MRAESYPGDDHDGPTFRLRLLDGFHLVENGRVLRTPHSASRVLALLGVRDRVGRVEMAGTLWPEVPETRANGSLRTVLWRLHRVTAAPLVLGRETLTLAPTVDVDVRGFVAAARHVLGQGGAGSNGAGSHGAADPSLATMGELLPGWYDDWALFERERLRQLQLHALEAMADQLTKSGRHAEAIEAALAAVRLEPLRESATRVLIAAHLAENNIVEAVRRYESFRDGLSNELGVQPTAELARLVQSGMCRRG
jgi:DNA-binding SARP family transcriptional activator